MVSRQTDPARTMQAKADRLVELYRQADPRAGSIGHSDRAALAEEAIEVWWEIYNQFVFWAQCELLGQDILQQRFDLLAMLRDRKMLRTDTERRLAEVLGYYFSVADKSKARERLLSMVGGEQLELVKLLAKAGLAEPGQFVRQLLSPNTKVNAYLDIELRRIVSEIPTRASLTVRDLDSGFSTDVTNWKLEAVRQVRLLIGRGLRKIVAITEVSSAIRHSIDELQQWERDLVKFSDYENDLFCAELVGEFDDQLRATHYTNIRNYKFYGSFEGSYNLERATQLARHMRQVRMSDIQQGLRGVREVSSSESRHYPSL
jgi:hypothetical protein